jgi:hypothetical protein
MLLSLYPYLLPNNSIRNNTSITRGTINVSSCFSITNALVIQTTRGINVYSRYYKVRFNLRPSYINYCEKKITAVRPAATKSANVLNVPYNSLRSHEPFSSQAAFSGDPQYILSLSLRADTTISRLSGFFTREIPTKESNSFPAI